MVVPVVVVVMMMTMLIPSLHLLLFLPLFLRNRLVVVLDDLIDVVDGFGDRLVVVVVDFLNIWLSFQSVSDRHGPHKHPLWVYYYLYVDYLVKYHHQK